MVHPDSELYSPYAAFMPTGHEEWAKERHRAKYLGRLESSLVKARFQAMESVELLRRLKSIWDQPEPSQVVDELIRRDLSVDEQLIIRDTLDQLLGIADDLPAKDRLVINRTVYRLLFRLSPSDTYDLRQRCLQHSRKLVRMAAYRAMRHHGMDSNEANILIEQYRKERDQKLLELVARWPSGIAAVDDHYVMGELRERYWRMRVIQALLEFEAPRAWAHAEAHPILFAWAVGRISHSESIKVLRMLLEEHQDDPEFIWWCIWTFGRAGTHRDVDEIERIAQRLIDHVDESCVASAR